MNLHKHKDAKLWSGRCFVNILKNMFFLLLMVSQEEPSK
jgi:hypothetical protein